MSNIVRELTEKEVRGIRRLVVDRCANYHEDYAELEQQHYADYAAFKDLREETQILWKIKSHIDAALKTKEKENTHTHETTI